MCVLKGGKWEFAFSFYWIIKIIKKDASSYNSQSREASWLIITVNCSILQYNAMLCNRISIIRRIFETHFSGPWRSEGFALFWLNFGKGWVKFWWFWERLSSSPLDAAWALYCRMTAAAVSQWLEYLNKCNTFACN